MTKNYNVEQKIFISENKVETMFDPAEHSVDFKGEAITFKATSEGVLATLQHCVELMVQREDAWRRRWEKEVEKKRKVQELYKTLKDQVAMHQGDSPRPRVLIHGGPDYEVHKLVVHNSSKYIKYLTKVLCYYAKTISVHNIYLCLLIFIYIQRSSKIYLTCLLIRLRNVLVAAFKTMLLNHLSV